MTTALPTPSPATLTRPRPSSALIDWDAEQPIENWGITPPEERPRPWPNLLWLASVERIEARGRLHNDAPYALVSFGIGAASTRWTYATPTMIRNDRHHLLITGTPQPIPGFVLPPHDELGRHSLVINTATAHIPTPDAMARAQARARARLEGELIRDLVKANPRSAYLVPAHWRVRGTDVIRWGAAENGLALPQPLLPIAEGLRPGERTPIVGVRHPTQHNGAHRWGWWVAVTSPIGPTDPLAHVIRVGIDAPDLTAAQHTADHLAWHLRTAHADGAPWPTITIHRQLHAHLGDQTMIHRRVSRYLHDLDAHP